VGEKFSQGQNCVGKLIGVDFGDGGASQPTPQKTIMVKHHLTIGSQPSVSLEARCPEAQRQLERLQGVLSCVGARPTVREPNWWATQRGKAVLAKRALVHDMS
jgi:hypothetical protein